MLAWLYLICWMLLMTFAAYSVSLMVKIEDTNFKVVSVWVIAVWIISIILLLTLFGFSP